MEERAEPRILPRGLFLREPSPHAAYEAIAREQRRGYLKRCAHISLIRIGDSPKASSYQVICIQDSFEPTTGTAPYFMGRCPKDCLLYRAPWRARLSQWRRNQHPVIWFERQPWQVKVALVAAIVAASILLAASYFGVVRDLTTLVRAIREVWRGK